MLPRGRDRSSAESNVSLRARLARMLRAPAQLPVILMYHRVAQPPVDPWGLAVSPERFRDQLRTLKRKRQPLAMSDFAARLAGGVLPSDAVALTFDDGYLDNLEYAKPILEDEGVPATVLVTTGWLDSRKLFWWDALTRMILLRREPFAGEVTIEAETIAFDIGQAEEWEPRKTWRSWDPPRSERERLYIRLWEKLQRLDDDARERHVAELSALLGSTEALDEDRVMTSEELARLPSAIVHIGAHAVTHQPLTSMSADKRRREIAQSRDTCRAITPAPIDGFCYPHGDYDAETRAIVSELGFAWACTTESRGVADHSADPYALPRIMAPDISGEALLRHIEQECA